MSKPILRIFRPETESNRDQASDIDAAPVSELEQMWREQELDQLSGIADSKTVQIPLSKVVPLLLDAADHQRAWLDDFSDDLISMNSDLYEILLAYQQNKDRAAA